MVVRGILTGMDGVRLFKKAILSSKSLDYISFEEVR